MSFKELPVLEFNQRLNESTDSILIDVREDYEYEDLNIGGVNIPMADVLSKSDEFLNYNNVFICCKSGKRSKTVAYHLSQLLQGINIFSLEGGLDAHFENL